MAEGKTIVQGADILPRYQHGGSRNARKVQKGKGSQTPGKKKGPTCQLTPVGGYPRKAFLRSRSYKMGEAYSEWCRFMDGLNGNSKPRL